MRVAQGLIVSNDKLQGDEQNHNIILDGGKYKWKQ